MDVWFTSDTHFNHANIIAYCKRPWLQAGDYDYSAGDRGKWKSHDIKVARCKDNDEKLISNWNAVVKPGDIVYHLGDFAFVDTTDHINRYVSSLNGQIHLILGNHDDVKIYRHAKFAWVSEKYQGYMARVGEQRIFLYHTRCDIWDKSHRGSWHLFGHSHGTLPDQEGSLSTDCGVDRWNYSPVNFDVIKSYMEKKSFIPIDSHK